MSKSSKIGLAAAVVALVLVGAGAFLILRNDAPERVSLDAAKQSAQNSGTEQDASPNAQGDSIEGTWVIDNDTGTFDWESATGTFAGFRVKEELANIGATEAVGRTGEVSGSLEIKGDQVTDAEFSVDLASIKTNNNMRDSRVRQALETDKHPDAKLRVTSPITLPEGAVSGTKISVTVPAELTVKGVKTGVELSIEAQLVNGSIAIVGSAPVTFADFDVEVPSSPIVMSVEDHGEMEFQALMKRG